MCKGGKKLLRYKDVESMYGIKRGTLGSMVSKRQIPHYKIGPHLTMFDADEISQWIKSKRVPATPIAHVKPNPIRRELTSYHEDPKDIEVETSAYPLSALERSKT